jgi:glyoxylase-like metal-dependent hydrolase (beta-lactamase superfamily II)
MPPFRILQLPLGPIQTTCYVVADEATRDAVVIDPGWDAPQVLAALAERQWTCRHVLLTHAHFDHIGAVADLVEATGAPLAVHPGELPLLRANGGAQLFGIELRPVPAPDVLLEPGRPLSAGSLAFDVLFVPGHTAGHVAFYHAAGQAVFSGDVLFQQSIGRTDLPGGDYDRLMRSLRDVMLRLPDETVVYSGHGPATTIGAEKLENPFLQE